MLTVTVLVSSCDCNQSVSGIVVDGDTYEAIDSGYVQNAGNNNEYSYTNNVGGFALKSISGGFRTCPPMIVSVTKPQYEIKTVEIENGGHDTIYLQRIK